MINSRNQITKCILASFFKIRRRYLLASILKQESRQVREDSLRVLYEFETLTNEQVQP
jgi:hypothetical protein